MKFLAPYHFALIAGAILTLSACAGRQSAGPVESPAPVSIGADRSLPKARPLPVKVSDPATTASSPTTSRSVAPKSAPSPQPPASPTPKPTPVPTPKSKSQAVGEFIRNGAVESEAGGILVVSKSSPAGVEAPGLFEDAIIQNRVRAALIANGHVQAAESVSVRGGVAELDLTAVGSPVQAAGAVDAVLDVAGVSKVRATGSD